MNQELLDKAVALADRGYQVGFEREDDVNGNVIWVAFVPEMPSCCAQGNSAESAIEALKTVCEYYIYFLLKHGVPVPDPLPREQARDCARTTRAEAEVIKAE
ncbi:MAG: type II toxin-antitoxin system HicB family antitoxin [Chloroflexi bacterium]|nr:type II toxin-antitoxin system HicB family antitoxin [Chloroflexota bacterium]